jgi:hypothetical protein
MFTLGFFDLSRLMKKTFGLIHICSLEQESLRTQLGTDYNSNLIHEYKVSSF